ncbi:HTH domain protein (plasmid) [Sulfitobacter sp. THAF37]|uniref:helix-turn-helix transcriptional regulator n=1 Tax=Sulfitobacter sp. THAF37 TaxID=2587855 RepID=UPI001268CFA2|nr:YafY family protein [Sulfitobacter sp. THAF37]QFT61167.1 HTH domain protein [Sulfitobacter sp. THAF37]
MRRADRLFEIIEILRRARGPIAASRIAAELEVSRRTVYRDIAALMAQRVPITGEAGVGYVLEGGFHMPPLMLKAEEIEAAVLGAQWVRTRGDPGLARAAEALLARLEAVAPPETRTFFYQPATDVAPVPPPAETLDATAIRDAIRGRAKIAMTYRDEQGRETRRTVWPILLGYRDAGRILAAWCELRGAFRYFRTERMLTAEILTQTFPQSVDRLRRDWRDQMNADRARYRADI